MRELINAWISAHAPAFSGVHVDTFGEYLGVLLGLGVSDQAFDKVTSKYFSICKLLSNSSLAPFFIFFYNSRASTLFSHLFQVFHPSRNLLVVERRVLHSVF